MIQHDMAFDEDYYVIDEPPARQAEVELRDPMDYRVVREQLLELVPATPRFQVYWTVPMDVEWDD
jgi:hypothetical protein